MKFFKKRIVDERMELQSLRNAKKCWNLVIILLAAAFFIQVFLMNRDFSYVLPEWLILMVAAVYNLYLDTRDGNIYTSENSNPKKVLLLYVLTAFCAGAVIAYGQFKVNPQPAAYCFKVFTFTFLLIFGLTLILDRLVFWVGKRRMDREREDTDEDN